MTETETDTPILVALMGHPLILAFLFFAVLMGVMRAIVLSSPHSNHGFSWAHFGQNVSCVGMVVVFVLLVGNGLLTRLHPNPHPRDSQVARVNPQVEASRNAAFMQSLNASPIQVRQQPIAVSNPALGGDAKVTQMQPATR